MQARKLYAFDTAEFNFDYSVAAQLRNIGTQYEGVCPFYLVDHPEGVVMYDTGVSYEMLRDPAGYGAPHMKGMAEEMEMSEDEKPVNQLVDAGYDPAEVDYVVLSHLHMDHAGSITDFPDAEFLVHQEELRYAWWPDAGQWTFYLESDFGALRSREFDVTVVDDRYDVFGDGSVVCEPTPGHTPGHQSLVVELDEAGTIVLAGDVSHIRDAFEQEVCSSFNWDMAESVRSIRKVREIARTNDADVYFLHDADDYERLPAPPEYVA